VAGPADDFEAGEEVLQKHAPPDLVQYWKGLHAATR
jgi:hypothetical protein